MQQSVRGSTLETRELTTYPRRHIEQRTRPDIARAIENFRIGKAWELSDLAAVTEVPRPLLMQVELGTCRLVPELVERLGAAFDVDPEVLQQLAELDGQWFDPYEETVD